MTLFYITLFVTTLVMTHILSTNAQTCQELFAGPCDPNNPFYEDNCLIQFGPKLLRTECVEIRVHIIFYACIFTTK